MKDNHHITPDEAATRPASEWIARRWMYMRGARVCRKLMRKAQRAALPGAVAYYQRHIEQNVTKAREANHAARRHPDQ